MRDHAPRAGATAQWLQWGALVQSGVRSDPGGPIRTGSLCHGGGTIEYLDCFATEAEAKARGDGRCMVLGVNPEFLDAGMSSGSHGVHADVQADCHMESRDQHRRQAEASTASAGGRAAFRSIRRRHTRLGC